MVVEIKIDSHTGDVAARAYIDSSSEHVSAAQMLERIAPDLEALQNTVLSASPNEGRSEHR